MGTLGMRLIHKNTGKLVEVGDTITNFRGEETVIKSFSEPHKPSSQGKVFTATGYEYYVGVYDMKWVDRDDR